MGPIGCPETSVINYHYWLRNDPEERSSRLHNPLSLEYENTSVSENGAQYFSENFSLIPGYMSL